MITALIIIGIWVLAAFLFVGTWAAANWGRDKRRELSNEEWEAWFERDVEYEHIPEEEIV